MDGRQRRRAGSDGVTRAPEDSSGDRFGLVFLLLISIFVLDAVVTDPRGQAAVLVICMAALLLVIRVTGTRRTAWPLLRAASSAVSLVLVVAALAAPGDVTAGVLALWLTVVLAATIAVIVRRVLSHRVVTMQTVLGGLSAYLLVGFVFTALYSAIAAFGPADFFAAGQPANSSTLQYFSFVTMTTTGYGDFTPAGSAVRSLAVLEAVLGQIFLVTLVARLVALFGQPRPGPVPSRAGEAGAQTSAPGPEAGRLTQQG